MYICQYNYDKEDAATHLGIDHEHCVLGFFSTYEEAKKFAIDYYKKDPTNGNENIELVEQHISACEYKEKYANHTEVSIQTTFDDNEEGEARRVNVRKSIEIYNIKCIDAMSFEESRSLNNFLL